MRSASPGFQGDRPGAPGFQLAENLGFDTQTPAAVAALEVVLTLDAETAHSAARNAATGDLSLVLTLDAVTRGPRLGGGGVGAHRQGIRYRADGELEVVLSLDAHTRFTDAIERDDEEVLEVLLLAGDAPAWPWGRRRGDDKAALIALVEADDAMVARRRERGG